MKKILQCSLLAAVPLTAQSPKSQPLPRDFTVLSWELGSAVTALELGYRNGDRSAWKTYLGRLLAIEKRYRGKTLRLPFVIRRSNAKVIELELPAARGQKVALLRLVVGRPRPNSEIGSDEVRTAEIRELQAAYTRNLFGSLFGVPDPQTGVGWVHLAEAKEAGPLSRIPGRTLVLDVKVDGLFVYFANPANRGKRGGISSSFEQLRFMDPAVERDLRSTALPRQPSRWGGFVLSTVLVSAPNADRFGRARPSVADLTLDDRPTSDFVCASLDSWRREFEQATQVVNKVQRVIARFRRPAWKGELAGLWAAAQRGAARSEARSRLAPWLAWTNDAEMLGLLWPKALRYDPDSYRTSKTGARASAVLAARRDIGPMCALVAVAGGGPESVNRITDDLVDPFTRSSALAGFTLAHFALAFGEASTIRELGYARFLSELRERVAFYQGLIVSSHPFARDVLSFEGPLDARPAWLSARRSATEAIRDAENCIQTSKALGGEERIERIGALRRLAAAQKRHDARKRSTTEHPGYRDLFRDSDKGMAVEGADGAFIFPENQTQSPAWSFQNRMMRVGATPVAVVPFAPDRLLVTPPSRFGLRPSDHALLIRGDGALQAALRSTPELRATWTHRHRWIGRSISDGRLAVRQGFEGARDAYRRALASILAFRGTREEIVVATKVEREALRKVLQREYWARPETFSMPGRPRGFTSVSRGANSPAGRARRAEAKPQPVHPESGRVRRAEERRKRRTLRKSARKSFDALLKKQPTFEGAIHQGSMRHDCSLTLSVKGDDVRGRIEFDGKFLKADKTLSGTLLAMTDGTVRIEVTETKLENPKLGEPIFPLRYTLWIDSEGGVRGKWHYQGTERGKVRLRVRKGS